MKKLLVVLLMLVSLSSIGQIKFSGTFEAGYEDRVAYGSQVYARLLSNELGETIGTRLDTCTEVGLRLHKNMYVVFDMNATYKGFELYILNKTYFTPAKVTAYKPNYI